MKASQANANLLEALPIVLRALADFRDNSGVSHSFCHEIDPGRACLFGTRDLIGALRALQRWVEENGYEDYRAEQDAVYEETVRAFYASIGAANRY